MRGASLPRRLLCGAAGAALLGASASIHLDLYLTGYRTIPTIGWLFLFQVAAGFALALGALVALVPRVNPLAEAAIDVSGALFALATLGGYLLSLRVGLFGFREVRTTAGIVAGVIDVAAFAALVLAALLAIVTWLAGPEASTREPRGRQRPWAVRPGKVRPGTVRPGTARPAAAARNAIAAVAAVSVIALVLLGVDVAVGQGGSGQPSGGTAGQVIGTTTVGGVDVLTNAKGLTLYWFAPDTSSASKCTGSCAQYWPPVSGRPTAGSGVTGTLGTISRPDGTTQATYDGHPLYTYIGDSSRGQASGNNLDLNGGLWHVVPVTG